MQASLTIVSDMLSPHLERLLETVSNRTRIHSALGVALKSLTKRAFTDSSLRPATWPDKKDGSPATLRLSGGGGGMLWKSINYVAYEDCVVLGSDRKYAAIHQLGGRTRPHVIQAKNAQALNIPGIGFRKSVHHPGSNIPARPYFPFDALGKPTIQARMDVIKVIERMVEGK